MILVSLPVGWWACTVTARHMNVADPGSIVWDEIVPFWLILLMTPETFFWQLAAFALFRYFDITKPQPARLEAIDPSPRTLGCSRQLHEL